MSRRQLPRAAATILDAAAFLPGEVAIDLTNDEMRYAGDGGELGGIALARKDGTNISVTPTGSTTARSLADRFADEVNAADYGVVSGSSADQSAAMQDAFDAAEGRTLILPDTDIYCKELQYPHLGITIRGTPCAYSVTGLGTRLILPAASNTYVAASESYVNNRAYSNYGVDIDGVTFDGNKANQSAASPLLILRTARSWLHDNVCIENSKGIGLLLTAKSANNTATNSMPENMIQARFGNCDEEGLYGADDSGNHLADAFVHNALFNACGGGATKKHSCYFERSAGVIISFCKFYGTGKGELYLGLAGRTIVTSNHFDITSAGQTTGTVNTVEISTGGSGADAHVVVNGNLFHQSKASAGSVTWQHLALTGGAANTIVSLSGNTFYSHSFSMAAYVFSGSGRVEEGVNTAYQCTKPSLSSSVRRVLVSNSAGTWTIAEAAAFSSTLSVSGLSTLAAISASGACTQSLAGGGFIGGAVSGEGTVSYTLSRYSGDALGPAFLGQKSRGTIASPSSISQFDPLLQFTATGYAGGAFRDGGNFIFYCWAATPSSTDMETQWRLNLSAAGSVSPTEFMRAQHATGLSMFGANVVIDASRGIRLRSYIATDIAAVGNAVNTAQKAAGKMIWDSTNNRVMVASGSTAASAWYVADGSASVTPS